MAFKLLDMNAKLTFQNNTTHYSFLVEVGGELYDVAVWLNSKGKFIGHEVFLNEALIDDEAIEQEILTYLDENWSKLTNPN
jgi:hypothetical protein